MPPIRAPVVDDSTLIRKVLTQALASDPEIQLVGTASDGRIALAKIGQLTPDLITLDVEMPNMSGLETIVEVRKLHPQLPIIMFSTLTERGATTTLDALALGASDYVAKPSNTGSLEVTMARIKQDLLPKIKALCGRRKLATDTKLGTNTKPPTLFLPKPTVIANPSGHSSVPIHVLAIGTSTGGPNALAEVLPAIPADFPVPVVIVQHMPPLFTRLLAERINKQSNIRIHEGEPGTKLEPGHAWIAPGDFHMTVEKCGTGVQLVMNQNAPENSCRPAVDVLFRSVAAVYGGNTLAVVLTGMGCDGVIGTQFVRERGGRVYIQDEATSVVWGMPGQVAAAGFADNVFPLKSIAKEIDKYVRESRQFSKPVPSLVPSRTN